MFHVLFSRLSVATVVALLVFVVSASLQPATALASLGGTADLRDNGSYLDNEWDNGNDGNNGNNNGNEWDGGNNNGNEWDNGNSSGNEWDGGGEGVFLGICALPLFAAHPVCTGGVLGLVGG